MDKCSKQVQNGRATAASGYRKGTYSRHGLSMCWVAVKGQVDSSVVLQLCHLRKSHAHAMAACLHSVGLNDSLGRLHELLALARQHVLYGAGQEPCRPSGQRRQRADNSGGTLSLQVFGQFHLLSQLSLFIARTVCCQQLQAVLSFTAAGRVLPTLHRTAGRHREGLLSLSLRVGLLYPLPLELPEVLCESPLQGFQSASLPIRCTEGG